LVIVYDAIPVRDPRKIRPIRAYQKHSIGRVGRCFCDVAGRQPQSFGLLGGQAPETLRWHVAVDEVAEILGDVTALGSIPEARAITHRAQRLGLEESDVEAGALQGLRPMGVAGTTVREIDGDPVLARRPGRAVVQRQCTGQRCADHGKACDTSELTAQTGRLEQTLGVRVVPSRWIWPLHSAHPRWDAMAGIQRADSPPSS
jgi:hypothetical protein